MPEQQQRPKMVMELASGRPSFDITHFSLHVSKRVVRTGHWLEDMRPYLADHALTAPDYDWADMSPGALRAATQPDGRIDSLPLETDIWLVYYNKQLFQQKGLAFPKTFDEMLATARKINDPANGIYGFIARGVKNANVPVWTSILLGQDQETVTPDGKTLLTDTPRRDLGRGDVQIAAARNRAARRYRVQLERMPDQLHAGQDRHVDGRRRRHAALAGPEGFEDRRSCRVRGDARRPEGAGLPGVHRRAWHPGTQQGEGSRLPLLPVGHQQEDAAQSGQYGRWCVAAAVHLSGSNLDEGQPVRAGMACDPACQHEDRAVGPAGDRHGDRIPRRHRHRAQQHGRWRRRGEGASRRDGSVQADPGAIAQDLSSVRHTDDSPAGARHGRNRHEHAGCAPGPV